MSKDGPFLALEAPFWCQKSGFKKFFKFTFEATNLISPKYRKQKCSFPRYHRKLDQIIERNKNKNTPSLCRRAGNLCRWWRDQQDL